MHINENDFMVANEKIGSGGEGTNQLIVNKKSPLDGLLDNNIY